jgi:uncharacterized protein YndB with AHSA1/START domain
MTDLPHRVDRSVLIAARRTTVFRFFTESALFADWWGPGSRIDPRPGGEVHIRYPGNVVASGQVVELQPPERIVFTYGYEDPAKPIAPGGSRVTITLEEQPRGTLVRLVHEIADAATRDLHVPGWRFQLSLFANVVAAVEHAGVEAAVDRWFALWAEPDSAARATAVAALCAADVSFHDRFGCIAGAAELAEHIGAAQRHMPGVRLERDGPVRHCQGTALADWQARGPDGSVAGRGTNVFDLAGGGRFVRVVGVG